MIYLHKTTDQKDEPFLKPFQESYKLEFDCFTERQALIFDTGARRDC